MPYKLTYNKRWIVTWKEYGKSKSKRFISKFHGIAFARKIRKRLKSNYLKYLRSIKIRRNK